MSSSSNDNGQRSSSRSGGGWGYSASTDLGFCKCNSKLFVQTSWTKYNPGRRFISCPRRGGKGCDVFIWVDPPICDRAKILIPGLLKKINDLEAQVEEAKKECAKAKKECAEVKKKCAKAKKECAEAKKECVEAKKECAATKFECEELKIIPPVDITNHSSLPYWKFVFLLALIFGVLLHCILRI